MAEEATWAPVAEGFARARPRRESFLREAERAVCSRDTAAAADRRIRVGRLRQSSEGAADAAHRIDGGTLAARARWIAPKVLAFRFVGGAQSARPLAPSQQLSRETPGGGLYQRLPQRRGAPLCFSGSGPTSRSSTLQRNTLPHGGESTSCLRRDSSRNQCPALSTPCCRSRTVGKIERRSCRRPRVAAPPSCRRERQQEEAAAVRDSNFLLALGWRGLRGGAASNSLASGSAALHTSSRVHTSTRARAS